MRDKNLPYPKLREIDTAPIRMIIKWYYDLPSPQNRNQTEIMYELGKKYAALVRAEDISAGIPPTNYDRPIGVLDILCSACLVIGVYLCLSGFLRVF